MEDLRGLRRYIAQRDPGSAAVVVARVRATCQTLEQFPLRGRAADTGGTREVVVPRTPYLVVYRISNDVVEIVRIRHGAQDWPPAP